MIIGFVRVLMDTNHFIKGSLDSIEGQVSHMSPNDNKHLFIVIFGLSCLWSVEQFFANLNIDHILRLVALLFDSFLSLSFLQ